MQSADSITKITAAREQLGTKAPHEFLRGTLPFRYEECKSCGNRTELVCIKCGFCYSCHWKEEEIEKKQLRNKLDNSYSSLPSSPKARDELTTAEDDELQQQEEKEDKKEEEEKIEQAQAVIVDVFGQKSEPICTYYRCHHKLSLHGLSSSSSGRGCRCKHPMNKTLGLFLKYS
jgi:hypothetical protein